MPRPMRCANAAAACAATTSATARPRLDSTWIGRVDGLEDVAAAGGARATGNAATTAWPGWRCSRTACSAAIAAVARTPSAPSASRWCSAPPPPASAPPRRPTRAVGRRRRRRFPPDLRSPDRAHPAFARRFRAAGHRSARPLHHRRHGLLVQRQGVRAGGAADPGRARRCRAGRRRRHPVRQRAVRLQLAGAGLGGRRAGRSTRSATACRWAKPAVSRCSNAPTPATPALQLRGYGESSDAHHMSAPHPEGLGAQLAMRDALARAGIEAGEVGYLNLHGTATPANDAVEARAVAALFPDTLHASSTKGWTGHTLGAAGIVESVFALLALEHGLLPGILNSAVPRPGLRRADPFRQRATRHPLRDEQFLRLRRQQLLAGVRARHDACRCSRPPSTASASGRDGLPSWQAARDFVAERRAARRRARAAFAATAGAERTPARAGNGRGRAGSRAGRLHRRRPRSGDAAVGVRLHPWRPRHHRLHVRDPGQRTAQPSRRRNSTTRCTTPPPATGPSAPAACAPTTAISAFDASFAQGLLEALAQLADGTEAVLLVGLRRPRRPGRWQRCRTAAACSAARWCCRDPAPGMPRLRATPGRRPTRRPPTGRCRCTLAGNAMAPMLPLFEALARRRHDVALLQRRPGPRAAGGDRA